MRTADVGGGVSSSDAISELSDTAHPSRNSVNQITIAFNISWGRKVELGASQIINQGARLSWVDRGVIQSGVPVSL